MKFPCMKRTTVSLITGLLVITTSSIGSAGSLAGSKGDVRFPPYLPGNAKDPCTRTYKAYVAATGHSAYATTPYIRVIDGAIICGLGLNAKSQVVAEQLAMKSCLATRAYYKVNSGGTCQIAASK